MRERAEGQAMRVSRTSMKVRAGRSLGWHCRGWGAAEYVLLMFFGTIGFLRVLQFALQMIREHHQEFSWALLLPF